MFICNSPLSHGYVSCFLDVSQINPSWDETTLNCIMHVIVYFELPPRLALETMG
jgi:hypothetical protein